LDGGKYRDGVEDVSTGLKTPQDATVVVVREKDATWKKFHPSGKTGKAAIPPEPTCLGSSHRAQRRTRERDVRET
jgi:hypothetical protein